MIEIGKCGKPHGLDGTLKCQIDERYIHDMFHVNAVFIGVGANPIPYFIESFREGNSILMKLEEVNSREDADSLAHKTLFLRPEDIQEVELPQDEYSDTRYEKWVGFQLMDDDLGTIGTIEEILNLPGHFTASVKYKGREVLIPLHENLILNINKEKKEITLSLPSGLLEL